MSSNDQLDLFAGTAPSLPPTNIVPFPLARRRKRVATAARTLLDRKTKEGQEAYWLRTLNGLAAELRRYGADQAEVDRQLSAFHRAVSDELSTGHGQRPGGAA